MTDTIESLRQQLAECRATNGKLREALKRLDSVAHISCGSVTEALALPNDATALNELIAERTEELTAEVEKWKLTAEQHKENYDILNGDLRMKNAKLAAQRDAAMKDAERYRWLKEHCKYEQEPGDEPQLIHATMQSINWRDYLDEAIDAAITNCKEQGG